MRRTRLQTEKAKLKAAEAKAKLKGTEPREESKGVDQEAADDATDAAVAVLVSLAAAPKNNARDKALKDAKDKYLQRQGKKETLDIPAFDLRFKYGLEWDKVFDNKVTLSTVRKAGTSPTGTFDKPRPERMTGTYQMKQWYGPNENGIPVEDFIAAQELYLTPKRATGTEIERAIPKGTRNVFYVVKAHVDNQQPSGAGKDTKYYYEPSGKKYFYKLGKAVDNWFSRLVKYVSDYGLHPTNNEVNPKPTCSGVRLIYLAYSSIPRVEAEEKRIVANLENEKTQSLNANGTPEWSEIGLQEGRGTERFQSTFKNLCDLLESNVNVDTPQERVKVDLFTSVKALPYRTQKIDEVEYPVDVTKFQIKLKNGTAKTIKRSDFNKTYGHRSDIDSKKIDAALIKIVDPIIRFDDLVARVKSLYPRFDGLDTTQLTQATKKAKIPIPPVVEDEEGTFYYIPAWKKAWPSEPPKIVGGKRDQSDVRFPKRSTVTIRIRESKKQSDTITGVYYKWSEIKHYFNAGRSRINAIKEAHKRYLSPQSVVTRADTELVSTFSNSFGQAVGPPHTNHKAGDYKVAAVRSHVVDGKSVADVCDFFKCTPRSLGRWVTRYTSEGSVARKESAPSAYKVTPAQHKHILKRVKKHPDMPMPELLTELKKKYPGFDVTTRHLLRVVKKG